MPQDLGEDLRKGGECAQHHRQVVRDAVSQGSARPNAPAVGRRVVRLYRGGRCGAHAGDAGGATEAGRAGGSPAGERSAAAGRPAGARTPEPRAPGPSARLPPEGPKTGNGRRTSPASPRHQLAPPRSACVLRFEAWERGGPRGRRGWPAACRRALSRGRRCRRGGGLEVGAEEEDAPVGAELLAVLARREI